MVVTTCDVKHPKRVYIELDTLPAYLLLATVSLEFEIVKIITEPISQRRKIGMHGTTTA